MNNEALQCFAKEFKLVLLQERAAQTSVVTWAEFWRQNWRQRCEEVRMAGEVG